MRMPPTDTLPLQPPSAASRPSPTSTPTSPPCNAKRWRIRKLPEKSLHECSVWTAVSARPCRQEEAVDCSCAHKPFQCGVFSLQSFGTSVAFISLTASRVKCKYGGSHEIPTPGPFAFILTPT